VEDVAEALFDEWEAELDQYTSAPLRRSSERRLQQTHAQYDQLIRAMKRAEAKTAPVLAAFHDQVLFLKHNLNAQAIASLRNLASIESDIAVLIREMEASIREANRFIDAMKRGAGVMNVAYARRDRVMRSERRRVGIGHVVCQIRP
jgi:DUF2959 family protein